MSTDKALHVDDEFRKVFEEYAESQEAFFADFAAAYKKLSECGARWKPVDGIVYEW
jgi:catalase (peroxidase I)